MKIKTAIGSLILCTFILIITEGRRISSQDSDEYDYRANDFHKKLQGKPLRKDIHKDLVNLAVYSPETTTDDLTDDSLDGSLRKYFEPSQILKFSLNKTSTFTSSDHHPGLHSKPHHSLSLLHWLLQGAPGKHRRACQQGHRRGHRSGGHHLRQFYGHHSRCH